MEVEEEEEEEEAAAAEGGSMFGAFSKKWKAKRPEPPKNITRYRFELRIFLYIS
jgi:hypothetical protein